MRALITLLTFLTVSAYSTVSQPALAQSQVVKIDASAFPMQIIVQKGTLIEFGGELSKAEAALPTTFVIRCSNMVRASGTFTKKWALQWDPSKEISSSPYALIFRAESGAQEVRIARVGVKVIDGIPFRLSAPMDRSSTDGSITVQVQKAGSLTLTGGEILFDGKPSGARLNAQGEGTASLVGLKPGLHIVSAKVAADGGGDFETAGVHVQLAERVKLSRSEVGPVDLRASTPRIPLHVSFPEDIKAKSAFFFFDDTPFAKSDTPPFDDVSLNGDGISTGTHSLRVEVTTESGERHVSLEIPLQVIGNAKNEFAAWYARVKAMLDRGHALREEFQQINQNVGRETNIGDLNEILKKLRASDLSIEYDIQKIVIPSSLSEVDRNELGTAMGEYRAGYSKLVQEEAFGLKAIATNTYYNENSRRVQTNINAALVRIAAANERVAAVARRLEHGAEDRQARANLYTYPVVGKPKEDFLSWLNQLDTLVDQAEELRQKYNTTLTPDNELAVGKSIAADTEMSDRITRLTPPKALPESLRTLLTTALQGVSASHSYRVQAAKLLQSALKSALYDQGLRRDLRDYEDPDSPNPRQRATLYNKSQITLAAAKEKVKSVAQQLGLK